MSYKQRNFLLYSRYARYYDLAYAWKGYDQEAEQVKDCIRRCKRNDGDRLLDVACGTGNFLIHLKDSFSCVGVDISSDMLKLAKRKNIHGVAFKKSDMANMSLGERFDVVLCLFGSSGYVRTYRNFQKTINGFSEHLNPGGIVIIEPWFTYPIYQAEEGQTKISTGYFYKPGFPYVRVRDDEEVKIARIRNSTLKGNVQTLTIHTVIAEKDKPIIHFVDRHYVGLFDINRTMKMMERAGLETRFDNNLLSGAFVGIKRG